MTVLKFLHPGYLLIWVLFLLIAPHSTAVLGDPAASKQPSAVAGSAKGEGSPRHTNRLILEDSPYLQQHAHNPVDWYPWGEEAFAIARRENRPIFLSIGYSTCHWCHVMERESFENEEVARILNENFIAIKVDREQRPDLDEFYMVAVQLLNSGSGGWPMNSILTPDGKTIVGGSYFSPTALKQLLNRFSRGWQQEQSKMEAQAEYIAGVVANVVTLDKKVTVAGAEWIGRAISSLLQQHDPFQGGFGVAPKFPQEEKLMLLLLAAQRDQDAAALQAAEVSLMAMARGGIHDQIGGGFHRYAIDSEWLVPHFEKMLYTQANLARVYTQAWLVTGSEVYRQVAVATLDYLLRDMTSEDGVFYSATDADSGGEEGAFFLWTPQQLEAALSPEEAERVIQLYGVTESGNFEGSNILHLEQQPQQTKWLQKVKRKLYRQREQREHPHRDEKIILSWNAMAIVALAEAGRLFDRERYLEAAKRAANHLWKELRDLEGGWQRILIAGRKSERALHEDYAHLARALVALYDATGDRLWLQRAEKVTAEMVRLFWDVDEGGFYVSDKRGGRGSALPTLLRIKSGSDSATSSGNAVALTVLAQLHARTGKSQFRQRATALFDVFSANIEQSPTTYSAMLTAFDQLQNGTVGPLQYGAGGKLKATAVAHAGGKVTITIEIAPGWHINAVEPLDDTLIATTVTASTADLQINRVNYPEPEVTTLGFQQQPLALYQGQVELSLEVEQGGESQYGHLPLQLSYQACSDEVCLLPEHLQFWVRPPSQVSED